MKTICLLTFITLIGNNCFSQLRKMDNKKHQLSYEKFIDEYAIDDTSYAIIDIYFDKRENNAIGRMTILPVAAVITLLTPPIGVVVMTISTPICISGAIIRNKYSRKKLLITLENYQNQHILAKNLKKKVDAFFEEELIEQEEIERNHLSFFKNQKQIGL